jgi:solute carrier family 6 amino acid transporter-like protein 5/7/9/14
MFSSYNPFRHNVARDALIISLMDTFTSLLAGVTIFSILGYLAHESGLSVDEVSKTGGPGLAFIAYPSAIAAFDWAPQLFAVLFFLMLFTLGLGSATSLAGGVITIICDNFPQLKTWQVTIGVCLSGYLIGLMYVTPGGLHILDLVDQFAATFVIYVAATIEVFAIAYIYGLNNFCGDIEFMLKQKRVNIYYKLCWAFIPVFLSAVLIYWAATYESPIPKSKGYNLLSQICGWLLSSFALSLIVIFGLHSVMKTKGFGFGEKLRNAFKPKADWGPVDPQLNAEWVVFKNQRAPTTGLFKFFR